MDYGSVIWGGTANIHLSRLKVVIIKAIRTMDFKKPFESVKKCNKNYQILNLQANIILNLGKFIVQTPPHPFLTEGSKFLLPPSEGGSEKLKKGGGSMVQGQFFLKEGDWHFSHLIF